MIETVAAGKPGEARPMLVEAMTARVSAALDSRKVVVARSIYEKK